MYYEVLKRCEFDEKADKIYQAIHCVDASDNIGDITKADEKDIPECDVLFSGSPCQSFSYIGLKEGGEEGSGTKSSLMWHNLRFIKQCNPKIIIWENVKGVYRGKNAKNFQRYCEAVNDMGYTTVYKVLNPRDFGIPQNRERCFTISIRNDLDASLFYMPMETGQPCDMFDYLDEKVDDKYIVPHQVMLGYDHKTSIFRDRFLIKKPGDIAYCLTAKAGRSVITNNYIFDDWNMYQNPPCKLNDLHYLTENNIPVRALTPHEYWRLQSIPDDFYERAKASGASDNQLYMRAGNAINVGILEAIFDELYKAYPFIFWEMKFIGLFSGIGTPEIALRECYRKWNQSLNRNKEIEVPVVLGEDDLPFPA